MLHKRFDFMHKQHTCFSFLLLSVLYIKSVHKKIETKSILSLRSSWAYQIFATMKWNLWIYEREKREKKSLKPFVNLKCPHLKKISIFCAAAHVLNRVKKKLFSAQKKQVCNAKKQTEIFELYFGHRIQC